MAIAILKAIFFISKMSIYKEKSITYLFKNKPFIKTKIKDESFSLIVTPLFPLIRTYEEFHPVETTKPIF